MELSMQTGVEQAQVMEVVQFLVPVEVLRYNPRDQVMSLSHFEFDIGAEDEGKAEIKVRQRLGHGFSRISLRGTIQKQ